MKFYKSGVFHEKRRGKFAYNGLVKFSGEWKKVEEFFLKLIKWVKEDMWIKKVTESMILDRIEWRIRIHVANHD